MIWRRFDLSNKVALVVGGRGFLGQRFATALSECGARVYAADLPEPSRAAAHDPARPDGGSDISQRTVDVSDPGSVQSLVSAIMTEASRIDILIYSVTTKPQDFYQPFTECSLEGWRQLMRVELDGLFLVAQQVGRVMETAGGGSMMFLSSVYGVVGNDQRIYEGANLAQLYAGAPHDPSKRLYSHAGYAAVKGAVIALTRFLAAYWGDRGIRVNCISPGGIAHPGEDAGFVERYSARVPMGRKAASDDVSGAVVYLASDASAYVTGHNLVIDGGLTAW
ncbi:MAG: SDR family oxidoreductase [Candidatus Omnitrophota bacterium]|nr:SDR family oxidoreductase [Candidatus Omnitrophota bacterium]